MCRLFGFRSVIPSAVHRSLLETENALGIQSARHPDGWGVAYYVEGSPHLVKSACAAGKDHIFHRVSGVVSSETVVAHVRKATTGPLSVLNSHPFQFGRWVFAHNGEIPHFDLVRQDLLSRVPLALRRFVLGETDSEVAFFLFLAALKRGGSLIREVTSEEVLSALAEAEEEIRGACEGRIPQDSLLLNFVVTNGSVLVASRRGKELYWSSYKTRCADRGRCQSLAPECEAPTQTGFVNHLIVSSEPMGGENVWRPLEDGHAVGVDGEMRLFMSPTGQVGQVGQVQEAPRPKLRVVSSA